MQNYRISQVTHCDPLYTEVVAFYVQHVSALLLAIIFLFTIKRFIKSLFHCDIDNEVRYPRALKQKEAFFLKSLGVSSHYVRPEL